MTLARTLRLVGVILLIWAIVPAVHALEIEGPQVIAVVNAPESFWVKSQAAERERRSGGGHKSKPSVKANVNLSKDADGLKKNNSIAAELAGSKSVPWSIVLGLTLLTLLPALLLSMTPLVRLLVVFHFLRQALGTQTAPSNQILMGLALMMTWFLMQPVLLEVEQQAVTPYSAGTMTGMEALDHGTAPVKAYMLRYAREKDLAVFASAGMGARPARRDDLPIQVVVPAYILSELKAGFQIGAVLFLPFLLVDLVVASITTSIGMMQLPPVVISTPLKILLFVMVDGWNLLADQLIKSF
jgi:flagellar biosynthesis protein FliP